jgi:hypothetical protein
VFEFVVYKFVFNSHEEKNIFLLRIIVIATIDLHNKLTQQL